LCAVRNIRRIEILTSLSRDVNLHQKQFIKNLQGSKRQGTTRARALCVGPASIVQRIQDQLLNYIFESREQGMSVNKNYGRDQGCITIKKI